MKPYLTVAAIGLAAVLAGCNKPADTARTSATDTTAPSNMAATTPTPPVDTNTTKGSTTYPSTAPSPTPSPTPMAPSSSTTPDTSTDSSGTAPNSGAMTPLPNTQPPITNPNTRDKDSKGGQ